MCLLQVESSLEKTIWRALLMCWSISTRENCLGWTLWFRTRRKSIRRSWSRSRPFLTSGCARTCRKYQKIDFHDSATTCCCSTRKRGSSQRTQTTRTWKSSFRRRCSSSRQSKRSLDLIGSSCRSWSRNEKGIGRSVNKRGCDLQRRRWVRNRSCNRQFRRRRARCRFWSCQS